eukprot:scaffold153799_cov29-Tisochrysis_lutea.AAC.15
MSCGMVVWIYRGYSWKSSITINGHSVSTLNDSVERVSTPDELPRPLLPLPTRLPLEAEGAADASAGAPPAVPAASPTFGAAAATAVPLAVTGHSVLARVEPLVVPPVLPAPLALDYVMLAAPAIRLAAEQPAVSGLAPEPEPERLLAPTAERESEQFGHALELAQLERPTPRVRAVAPRFGEKKGNGLWEPTVYALDELKKRFHLWYTEQPVGMSEHVAIAKAKLPPANEVLNRA